MCSRFSMIKGPSRSKKNDLACRRWTLNFFGEELACFHCWWQLTEWFKLHQDSSNAILTKDSHYNFACIPWIVVKISLWQGWHFSESGPLCCLSGIRIILNDRCIHLEATNQPRAVHILKGPPFYRVNYPWLLTGVDVQQERRRVRGRLLVRGQSENACRRLIWLQNDQPEAQYWPRLPVKRSFELDRRAIELQFVHWWEYNVSPWQQQTMSSV